MTGNGADSIATEERLRASAFSADASRAIESAWQAFVPLLRWIARQTTDDRDAQEDLLQEARIQLWRSDPTRFDLANRSEYRYLRRIVVNRMLRARRSERDRVLRTAARFK